MQEILDRYGHNDSPYLFPVIRDTAKDAVRQYRSAAHFINGKLKGTRETARARHAAHDVCSPPCMGEYCQKQECAAGNHQRGDGT